MKGSRESRKLQAQAIVLAIARLGTAFVVLILTASRLPADESPSTRLVRCGRNEAEITLAIDFQIPGSAPMQDVIYAKHFRSGDEQRPRMGPSKTADWMGTETSTWAEFGETEATVTIRQVPGPDRLNPYQVVIHALPGQDLSGTIEGTKYEITWIPLTAGERSSPYAYPKKGLLVSAPGELAGPIVNSVNLSPSELMMLPHDARLEYDFQHDSETGSGDWVRLRAKGPSGEVAQTFRIQVIDDPGGNLGMAEVAEAEVKTLCAPYLSNSLERKCEVQRLKRASGDVYYCLMSNSAFANSPTPPAEQFRYLFLGVFRISGNVAFVVGNLSQKDDVNFRMMMETLGRISTLPITNGSNPPANQVKSVNSL